MTIGVTIGKFHPLHLGHDRLIRVAKEHADHLVVLCCARDHEIPAAEVRAGWISAEHPDVEVLVVQDDLPEEPEPWARRTLDVLGGRRPDVAFTGEGYGAPWAASMGATHVLVDRSGDGISATAIREDPAAHWSWLTPAAKAGLAPRVCVLGAESTGTTTLAQALAEHHRTVWVPEHGRWYWLGRRHAREADTWRTDEFLRIATAQQRLEDDLARLANRIVVCDTDALATHVWHRRYLGRYDDEVHRLAMSRDYEMYLVTTPDFPFVQDGTRDGEAFRERMHTWFVEALEEAGRPYALLWGTPADRLGRAIQVTEPLVSAKHLRTRIR